MKISHDLFNLIHSLSRTEKRYFRLYTQQNSGGNASNYLKLFDALLEQDQYDEAGIKSRFAGEKFTRHFSVAKSYLYDLVLKALQAYHHAKTPASKVRHLLDQIDILLERGMIEQARKLQQKAEKVALQNGYIPQLVDLQLQGIRIQKHGQVLKPDLIKEMYSGVLSSIDQLKVEINLRNLHDKVYSMLAYRVDIRKPENLIQLNQWIREDLPQRPKPDWSLDSNIVFQYIHIYHRLLLGEHAKTLPHFRQMLNLWESHPKAIQGQQERYLKTINGFLDICLEQGEMEEFQRNLDKIKALRPSSKKIEVLAFRIPMHQELRRALSLGHYENAIALIPTIETGLLRYKAQIPKGVWFVFAYNIMVACLLGAELSICLKWINQVLNSNAPDIRIDVQQTARIFSLLAHLELGNPDLVEYQMRSSARYLKKQEGNWEFEEMVFKTVREILRLPPEHSANLSWLKLLEQLELLHSGPLGLLELKIWIKLKTKLA